MASATVRQGRPKGSGLDDSKQLARIAALLAADPKLKPTTAIRSLGIEDPSLIRRLRSKYRDQQGVLQSNAQKKAKPKTRSVAAAKGVAIPERETSRTSPSISQASPIADSDVAPTDIFAAWCGFGLSVVSTAIENQHAITQHLLRQPSISIVVKSQLLLSEFALATCQRTRRRTLHAN